MLAHKFWVHVNEQAIAMDRVYQPSSSSWWEQRNLFGFKTMQGVARRANTTPIAENPYTIFMNWFMRIAIYDEIKGNIYTDMQLTVVLEVLDK